MIHVPWTMTPPCGVQLDRNHPLSQGITTCYVFNETGGTKVIDYASSYNLTLSTGAKLTERGLFLDTSTLSVNRVVGPTNITGLTNNMTVICSFTPLRKSSTLDVCLVGKWDSGNTPANCEWDLSSNYAVSPADYYPSFFITIGSSVYYVAHTVQYNVGVTEVIAGVRKGAKIQIHRNGSFKNENNCGTGAINSNVQPLRFGAIALSGFYNSNNYTQYCYIYNRALSAQEIKSLYENPYQIFQPITLYNPLYIAAYNYWCKVGGTWEQALDMFVKINGGWEKATDVPKVKVGGAWI